MTDKRITPTKALEQALEALLPGAHEVTLDDEEIRGPRGGLRGYRRAEGAGRPGEILITRAVCDADHCNERIEHGHSFWLERGGTGKYAKTVFTGPTFRSSPEVGATLAVLTDLARSNKGQAIDLDEARGLIAAAVAAHKKAARAKPELMPGTELTVTYPELSIA